MPTLLEEITSCRRDAVLFKAEWLLQNAGKDVDAYTSAVNDLSLMLACIKAPIKRDSYMQTLSKKHKIKITLLKSEVDKAVEEKQSSSTIYAAEGVKWRFQKGVDPEDAWEKGWYAVEEGSDTGYWFRSGDGYQRQSTFILKALMHIRSQAEDKRMVEVINQYMKVVIDMPSRSVISVDQSAGIFYELGNNLFYGNKLQWMKIINHLGPNFEMCEEMKILGWQPEGFFAYSNGIITADGFVPMDDRGIAEFNGKKYYSPSASVIYRTFRQGDDEYANDRYLSYKTPAINFEEWCRRMVRVYTESNSGILGIAYVMLSAFRDVVFSIDNNSPHLSAIGEKGCGKSKFNESLSAFFFNDMPPLNLFHSTDFAFANRISRYANCVVSLDEFNDATIREERFEQVKAGYDGLARERGKGGSKNKTEIIRVASSMVLAGQYLSTKDDNAALTRCIIIPFRKRSDESARNNQEVQEYNELKTLEKQGLSGLIIELLQHRKEFEKEYVKQFPDLFADLRTAITEAGGVYNERVMRNYNALLTCVKFFSDKFKLPITYDEFLAIIRQEVVKLSTLIAESDSTQDFWNTIVYLMETGEIYDPFHYKLEGLMEVVVKGGKRTFPQPKKLLFLRLTTIHTLYMEAHRRSTGKNGVNLATLEHYLSTGKGFIGKSESGRFTDKDGKTKITSSYVFDYELLNVALEQEAKAEEEKVLTELTGKLHQDCKLKQVTGVPKLCYKLVVDQSYKLIDKTVESLLYYNCYDPDLNNEVLVTSGHPMVITGVVTIKRWTDKEGKSVENRNVEVSTCRLVDNQLNMTGEVDLPF